MIDEAPFMPPPFWRAAKPLLADFGGDIWMWGTFDGTEGYFYESYVKAKKGDGRFKLFEKTTEEVFRERPVSASWTKERKERNLNFLAKEKAEMSIKDYNQEYMAIAAVDTTRLFSEAWIDSVCILQKGQKYVGKRYMACDPARMGGDEIAIVIGTEVNNILYHEESIVNKYQLTTETERQIYSLWKMWNVAKLGLDAGAGTLGVSIYDHLQKVPDMGYRIIAMNNRSMSVNRNEGKQRLLNEDMHDNLRAMGEREEIHLFNNEEIKASLRSVQWDLVKDQHGRTRVKIYGRFTHITEGLKFAAYLANEKLLNIHIHWI